MEIEEAVQRMSLAKTSSDPRWSSSVKVTDEVVRQAPMKWLAGLLVALLRRNAPTEPMRYGVKGHDEVVSDGL